jgi:hypothetical protein
MEQNFFTKHWLTLAAMFLSGLWLYLQLLQWKKHGDDFMLTAATIVVTAALWAVLIAAYAKYRRMHKDLTILESKRPDIIVEVVQESKRAGHQAALFWFFAASAKNLTARLEEVWHHWNYAGEALIYPIGGSPGIKKLSEIEAIDLIHERRDFMLLYMDHVTRIVGELPTFSSSTVHHGYPCDDREYVAVLADLKEHAEHLQELGNRVWESGQAIEPEGNAK